MKKKKIPMRMCIVTRERVEKKNLIRIVATDSNIVVDPSGKINGHGVYIKKDIDVIDQAKRKKILDNVFETVIDDKIYEEAKELVENE